MRLEARVLEGARDWLAQHPDQEDSFYAELSRVRADELMLINNSEPFLVAGSRYTYRFFRFGTNLAMFVWTPAKRILIVVEIRSTV